MAALFFHKLLDKQPNADHVTVVAFMTACYESNKYELVSAILRDFSQRTRKG